MNTETRTLKAKSYLDINEYIKSLISSPRLGHQVVFRKLIAQTKASCKPQKAMAR
jgi:hypothetical protein